MRVRSQDEVPRSLCSPSLRVGRSGGMRKETLDLDWRPTEPSLRLKKIGLVANGVGFESRTLTDSGGIHQPNHETVGQPLLFQMISGCSGHIINQGELLVRQCVEKGALSGVGWSEDGHRGGRQQHIKSP